MDLPILTTVQMRAAEEAAFASGVQVETLMNKAGAGVAEAACRARKLGQGPCAAVAVEEHDRGARRPAALTDHVRPLAG